jgi:hypothetical protein
MRCLNTPVTYRAAGALFAACFLIATGASLVFVTAAVGVDEPLLSPDALVTIDRSRDGERVTVQGEAIGESLRADSGHRWVNVLGDSTAVGIFTTNADAAGIGNFGSYRHTGDIVRVTGILNVACDQHGGEFDEHAEVMEVVAVGTPTEHPIGWWKLFVVLVAAVVLVVEVAAYRRRGRRSY